MVGSDAGAESTRAREAGKKLAHPDEGEEIVISGMAGRFPDSDDVAHLRDNLFAKRDLISNDQRRWKLVHDEIPQRTGKINHVNKFDAGFFGIHFKQAHCMDPQGRMLLERAYEAIVDAGINPKKLQGTKCGVFVGSCFSESEKTWFYERMNVNGFGILGSSRAMLTTRISYWLGATGPSYTVDSACSSSLYAVEHAYRAIRDGHCDTAIVGGCNLCLHPYVSLQFNRLGVLSPDGRCKVFDCSANGYCRAEAVACIFLQRAKDVRRVYATLVHAKTNCDGYKEQGITYPSGLKQRQLLEDFYEECEIKPSDINYIEAHGTGTKVGDPEECEALDKVFCKGREGPLLVGSIKSNMGHSEPASGLCSIVKVLIAMETGKIPPNLWFNSPKEGIQGFSEGRLKVVDDVFDLPGGLVGVNSFGFGGANCHVLMKWNEKVKVNGGLPSDNIPRLINVSGRTEESVKIILDELEKKPVDVEFCKLLHDIHADDIPGHLYRGFIVISNDRKIRDVQFFPGQKRPVWLIFSGLGSQWPAMGKSLMKIPVFASAIERCAKALQDKKVDLLKIITSDDPKVLDSTINAVVGVVAVQIGLVDILQTLGIFADNMIGHSIGELGCSYADGSLTAEQTILAAYYRGLVTVETDFIRGSMAAVGMGYKKIKNILPPEIEVACHNGPDSCTLSGPTEALKAFVSELTVQGVFTKEVPSSHTAYHSRYVAKAGPKLLNYLQNVIPQPKARTSKWISTSVSESKGKAPVAKFSSAEYHTNNFLSPVLFEEAIKQIPFEAVTIEVAPHGLLQPILRRALNKITTNVALTQRGHADNAQVLFTGIGKLYEVGLQPHLANIYPAVSYPVSRGTPMISPLVRWDHNYDWFVTSYRMQETIKGGERTIRVQSDDNEWQFVLGHVIDGRNLFPATGYIVLVWETLAMMRGMQYQDLSVVFENIKFNRATNVPKGGAVNFTVLIQKGSGTFEVMEGGVAVVTGRVYHPNDVEEEMMELPVPKPVEGEGLLPLTSRDIYKELRLRGYNYSGLFRGLQEIDSLGRSGRVAWNDNWVAFMDNMLQIQILHEDTRGLYVPTSIHKLVIDPKKQIPDDPTAEVPTIPVYSYENILVLKAGGVEVRELMAQQIPRRKALGDPVLEKYEFTPHYEATPEIDLLSAMKLCIHIALENVQGIKVKVVELGDETVTPESILVAPYVAEILGDLPLIQAEIIVISNPENPKAKELGAGITVDEKKLSNEQNCLAVIGSNILSKTSVVQQAFGALREKAFIIAREDPSAQLDLSEFNVITDVLVGEERILLLNKKEDTIVTPKVLKVSVDDDFSWLPVLKEMIKDTTIPSILVVSENEPTNGIVGFVNCIRKEPEGEKVRGLFISDNNAPTFDIENPFYADEINKGTAMMLYVNGQWGSLRHQSLPPLLTIQKPHGFINNAVRGDLSSFKFFEGPLNVKLENGEVGEHELVYIYYCSINFRDVMLTSGKLSADVCSRGRINQEIIIGFEFSGKTASGKRVMGMISGGAMTSHFSNPKAIMWDVPDEWSLADAATIPVVYGTVLSSLYKSGRIRKGDTILIHSATGGVGLAAVIISLKAGATVFVTVGTQEKRDYLHEHFPMIPDSHIGNSRDTSFEAMIKRETNGRGVDIVLNSLAEEKLQASIRCLAKGGRFLEIGKFDIAQNNPLGMEMFADDASFHAVMLDLLFDGPHLRKEEIKNLLMNHMHEVEPLKRTIFSINEVEQAFRFMSTGKHIGKVMLKMREEEEDRFALPTLTLQEVVPRFFASSLKSYIVTGGLGGFGLELADWLALRGARNIVLTSRTGLRTGYQAFRIRLWRSYGAKVVIATDDITTEEGCTSIIKKAEALGPVDGIFNLAVVLRDAIFENQTEEDFRISFGPKALAAQHLDKVSRKMCPALNHFVIFSSVSCGRGNAGQTNYGMANSVMERICEQRKAVGLPGLAIQWGAIGDVGLVAEMQEEHVDLVIGGTLQQSISSCLACMDTFLKHQYPIVSSMVVAEKRAAGSGAGNIVDTVVGIMGIKDLKTVSLHSSLAELGMDSMMAVEIKQTLEREFEVFLTAQDIRGLTFAKLAELDAKGQAEGDSLDKNGLDGKAVPRGIGFLFRLVGDELSCTKTSINLQTLQETPNPIILIPGLEGMATVFEPLAQSLTSSAVCLQFPYNKPAKSMQEVAKNMYPILLSKINKTQSVTLVGYSTGAFVAMELAYLLESSGYKVKLILLDGTPDWLQYLAKAMGAGETDEELQTTVIHGVYNVLVPGTNEGVKEELMKMKSWEDKLTYARSVAPTDVPHSIDHQTIMMVDLYYRMKNVIEYKKDLTQKIKGKTILIRPSEQSVPNILTEDYNLSAHCEQPVEVIYVDGNHLTMLDSPKLSDILNTVHIPSETSKSGLIEANMIKLQTPNAAKAV